MFIKKLLPILALFVAAMAICLSVKYFLPIPGLKIDFVIVVNTMLFIVSYFNLRRMSKMDITKPTLMVQSVMLGSLLKMIIFAGAALVYATQKKGPVGISTLLVSMCLYLIYTWLEINTTKQQ
jgi:lipid-A-disaccharide synthase-like uncharacterized protein